MTGPRAPISGLRDAHVHIAYHGEELRCIQLADCRSREECLERLAREADRRRGSGNQSSAEWITAVGARLEAWRGPPGGAGAVESTRYPTAREIDEATGGLPAIVMSFDHHAIVAGGAVLRSMGVTSETPDPPGGIIEKRDGELTGLMLEGACQLVRRAAPEPTRKIREERMRAGLEDFQRRGFVEVHDMLTFPWMAEILAEIDARDELGLEVWVYPLWEHFEEVMKLSRSWREDGRLRLAGMKIFTDGTLNSRTAWMLTGYTDPLPDKPCGTPLMTMGEIEEAVRFADERGYPIAAHAIGDGAVRAVLDALERARPSTLGHRIEHAQFVDEADVPRFAELGAIASVQPCHLLTDIEAIRRLMPHRAGRAFPLRDLAASAEAAGFDAPDLVWLGSDAPIVAPDPADNLQAAVLRRRAGMPESEAIGPAQSVTEEVALACMRSRM